MSAHGEKIEKASEELNRVCDDIGWVVDEIIEQDLGSATLLEANVRFTIESEE